MEHRKQLVISYAAIHDLALALNSADYNYAIQVTSLLKKYLTAAYECIQERVDFFTDSLEYEKSEAIQLQKYLHKDDKPFASGLSCQTKKSLNELRAKALAKVLNKQNIDTGSGKQKPNGGKRKNGGRS